MVLGLNIEKLKILFGAVFFAVVCSTPLAIGGALSYSEVLYEGSSTNTSVLSGDINLEVVGNTLTFNIMNTSSAEASNESSHNLLTAMAFNLPTGMEITDGTVFRDAETTAINFSSDVFDVSGEWGYDNSPITSGPFNGVSQSSLNTAISAMRSSSEHRFSETRVAKPTVLAGPEFGLLSLNVDESVAGGLHAIQSSVTVTVNLSGTFTATANDSTLFDFINNRDVAIAFGSPGFNYSSNTTAVPEPSTYALILCGLIGIKVIRRRR